MQRPSAHTKLPKPLPFESREHCPAFLRACTLHYYSGWGHSKRPSPSPQQPHPSGKPPSLPASTPIGAKLAAWFGGKTEQRSGRPRGASLFRVPQRSATSRGCCCEAQPLLLPGNPGSWGHPGLAGELQVQGKAPHPSLPETKITRNKGDTRTH